MLDLLLGAIDFGIADAAAHYHVPLLLTAKLTLSEVYWKTAPMTSWMQALIGDPLYRPYAKNPLLKPADLPATLRAALPIN